MKSVVAKLVAQIGLDTSGLRRELTSLRSVLRKGLLAAVAGAVAGVSFAAVTVGIAAAAEEGANKFKEVFKSATLETREELLKFSREAGRSAFELETMASSLGALLRPLGMTEKQTSDFSVTLTKLATDLASFNNTTDAEALTAIFSGLVGESEPLRRYGVQLSQARIEAEALAMGLIKTKKEMTPLIKTQAAISIIMKDTTQAQGDAVRTAGSFVNRMRALQGTLLDLGVAIGNIFLPAATKLADAIASTIAPLRENTALFNRLSEIVSEEVGRVLKEASQQFGDLAKEMRATFTENEFREVVRNIAKGLADIAEIAVRLSAVLLPPLTRLIGMAPQLFGVAVAFKAIQAAMVGVGVASTGMVAALPIAVFASLAVVAADAAAKNRTLAESFLAIAASITGAENAYTRWQRVLAAGNTGFDAIATLKEARAEFEKLGANATADQLTAMLNKLKMSIEEMQSSMQNNEALAKRQAARIAELMHAFQIDDVNDIPSFYDTPVNMLKQRDELLSLLKQQDALKISMDADDGVLKRLEAMLAQVQAKFDAIAKDEKVAADKKMKGDEYLKDFGDFLGGKLKSLGGDIVDAAKRTAANVTKDAVKLSGQVAAKALDFDKESIQKMKDETMRLAARDAAVAALAKANGIDEGIIRQQLAMRDREENAAPEARTASFVGLAEMARRIQTSIGNDPQLVVAKDIEKNTKKAANWLEKVNAGVDATVKAIQDSVLKPAIAG